MRNHSISGNPGTLIQVAFWSCLIVVLNQIAELKDREAYRLFYESVNSCEGLECLLISVEVRSPIFLSILLGGQRLGLDFEMLFTVISLCSLWLAAWAMLRTSGDDLADARFTLMSMTFGTWLYLIQVKLFLGIALFLLARQRQKTWQRVTLMIAAVLTHETILLVLLLEYHWKPMTARATARVGFAFIVLAAVLVALLGEATNVVATAVERIDHYNQLVAEGGVSAVPRFSVLSAMLFLFGVSGLLPLGRAFTGVVDRVQLKSAVWMFLPWLIFLALAGSEIFAIRLSELALLHAFWVVKLAPDYTYPSRLAALAVAACFGAFTFVRDIAMT